MSQFYHIYNRGVEKRDIFMDKEDHFRFIQGLYEFNDQEASKLNFHWKFNFGYERESLVNIHCFCLMPNHFHLILESIVDKGVSLFMQKLGTGYTNYFNKKYQRVGSLFQGTFKKILIEKDEYLLHLSRYQHLNPIELIEPNWKEQGIRDWQKAGEFLKSYQWSSYLDYIGIKTFPLVTNREFISGHFSDPKDYETYVTDFIPEDIIEIKNLII